MFGEIFQIEKILGVCDRILCICAFQKDVCFSLLFYFIGNSEFWKHKKRTGVYRTYVR